MCASKLPLKLLVLPGEGLQLHFPLLGLHPEVSLEPWGGVGWSQGWCRASLQKAGPSAGLCVSQERLFRKQCALKLW